VFGKIALAINNILNNFIYIFPTFTVELAAFAP
jgi:hypothetical protein